MCPRNHHLRETQASPCQAQQHRERMMVDHQRLHACACVDVGADEDSTIAGGGEMAVLCVGLMSSVLGVSVRLSW